MSAKVFWETYEGCLRAAIETNPADYGRAAIADPAGYAKEFTDKISKADWSEVDHQGRGFYMTCKKLGIKHARKAIKAYLEAK